MRKIIDSLSTIAWFCMDICWAYDMFIPAMIFLFFAVIGPLSEIQQEFNPSTWMLPLATISWIMMNATWMINDYYPHPVLPWIKLGFTLLGIIFLLLIAKKDINQLKLIRKFAENKNESH